MALAIFRADLTRDVYFFELSVPVSYKESRLDDLIIVHRG